MPDETDQPEPLDSVTTALEAQGFPVLDRYPANHRLRAEALAQEGVEADPANHITPEAIADAKARLDAEAKDAAEHTPSANWTKAQLVDHATSAGVDVDASATKADILNAIEAADPAPSN